jgi:hypothetical protein
VYVFLVFILKVLYCGSLRLSACKVTKMNSTASKIYLLYLSTT